MHPFRAMYYRAIGHYPVSIRGIKFRCSPSDFGFWRSISRGEWEPGTLDILERFLTPDSVYFDIGAWIGPTVLFAARRCRQVYCFEPDRIAFQHLIRNLSLNRMRHVQPFNLALSDRDGMLTMGAGMNGKLGKSTTSALRVTSAKTIRVLALSWKSWFAIAAPEKPDLIKIDIEGGEFALLPTMAEYLASVKPALLLSTHAFLLDPPARHDAMQNLARLLSFYGTCRDERLMPISLDAFVSPESLNRPRSFLLTP